MTYIHPSLLIELMMAVRGETSHFFFISVESCTCALMIRQLARFGFGTETIDSVTGVIFQISVSLPNSVPTE